MRLLLVALLFGACTEAQGQSPPMRAAKYKRPLTRAARAVWGPSAPVALFAAQIHQESSWRPSAESPFARGLAQFTPATETWIEDIYPELRDYGGALDWRWGIRAMVLYNWRLHKWTDPTGRYAPLSGRARGTKDDWFARMLAAYNGGLRWLQKEAVSARARFGCDPSLYFRCVTRECLRAPANCEESHGYARRILFELRPRYAGW